MSHSHLLHACGDVSPEGTTHYIKRQSAPRMWRCFSSPSPDLLSRPICSTHVEMFPFHRCHGRPHRDLLHACGDVSKLVLRDINLIRSAPRMWRCFSSSLSLASISAICSTHVENFSIIFYHKSHLIAPRMWRCFLLYQRFIAQCFDCSTYVEIFSFLLGIWSQMTSSISYCLT